MMERFLVSYVELELCRVYFACAMMFRVLNVEKRGNIHGQFIQNSWLNGKGVQRFFTKPRRTWFFSFCPIPAACPRRHMCSLQTGHVRNCSLWLVCSGGFWLSDPSNKGRGRCAALKPPQKHNQKTIPSNNCPLSLDRTFVPKQFRRWKSPGDRLLIAIAQAVVSRQGGKSTEMAGPHESRRRFSRSPVQRSPWDEREFRHDLWTVGRDVFVPDRSCLGMDRTWSGQCDLKSFRGQKMSTKMVVDIHVHPGRDRHRT